MLFRVSVHLYSASSGSGAEALYQQATQYGVMDHAAIKSYALLLLEIRGRLDAAVALHRQL